MFSKVFMLGALERGIKSAAQAVLLFLGADLVDLFSVDFMAGLGAAAAGFVLSVLTSIISSPVGMKGTASMVKEDK